MRGIWGLLGCLLVAACALPMADSQSDAAGKRFETPPAGLGALYIYRTSDSPLDRTSRFRVMLVNDKGDTRKLGILDDDTWFLLNLPPGNYTVRCEGGDAGHSSNAPVTVAGGGQVFAQIRAFPGRWVPNCAASSKRDVEGRAGVARGKRVQELPPGAQ